VKRKQKPLTELQQKQQEVDELQKQLQAEQLFRKTFENEYRKTKAILDTICQPLVGRGRFNCYIKWELGNKELWGYPRSLCFQVIENVAEYLCHESFLHHFDDDD